MTADPRDTDTDILVVGTGAAGLSATLAAAGGVKALRDHSPAPSPPPRIVLLTRGTMGRDGASTMAQGGVAAALHAEDSPGLHALDTLLAGAGLGREDRVAILTSEGPGRVRELIELGARFDREESGSLALAMEGAHSRRRVIHALGDRTGAEVTAVLTRAVRQLPGLRILEGMEVASLHLEDGRVRGVAAVGPDGPRLLRSRCVILATGGPCHLFLRTTTPPSTTGDGLAMADRAGARLVDMEFVQFHPTALAVDADPLPLVTEALRGEGAVLVDRHGRRIPFPGNADELSSRDLVARTLWSFMKDGEPVFLDARTSPGPAFPDRFPGVFADCRRHGIDPRVDLVPVTPAAHYHMGGIEVDDEGRTSLEGLRAAGEVASTGVHGANRLASNSLLEGLVFGARAGDSARREVMAARSSDDPAASRVVAAPEQGSDPRPAEEDEPDSGAVAVLARIRTLLWHRVGLVRDAASLNEALEEIASLEAAAPPGRTVLNALLVARRIAEAALAREESRGSHYRSDFPHPMTK